MTQDNSELLFIRKNTSIYSSSELFFFFGDEEPYAIFAAVQMTFEGTKAVVEVVLPILSLLP